MRFQKRAVRKGFPASVLPLLEHSSSADEADGLRRPQNEGNGQEPPARASTPGWQEEQDMAKPESVFIFIGTLGKPPGEVS